MGELVRGQTLRRGPAEAGERGLREHHGGRPPGPEAGHSQATIAHGARVVSGGRAEVGDHVRRRRRDVRQGGSGRHRRGGPPLQRVVDGLSVTACAPVGEHGRERLRQRRDHQEGAGEVGDRHGEEEC
jgi:hypothetical protein